MPRVVVLLMPWGRVGSNLVNQVVGSTQSIKVWNEPLTGVQSRTLAQGGTIDDVRDRQADWIKENIQAAPTDVFLNLAADSVQDPAGLRRDLDTLEPTYLVLDRKDVLATAISALRTEAWVAAGVALGEKRSWAIPKGLAIDFRPRIELERLSSALRIIERGRRNIETICCGLWPTRYFYEDLILDMRGVVSDILVKAGIPAFDFDVRSGKFGSTRLSEMVENAEEISSYSRERRLRTELILA